jgi:septum formation protein
VQRNEYLAQQSCNLNKTRDLRSTGEGGTSLKHKLILASASPRRRELLAQAGYEFEVIPANIPEEHRPGEDPTTFVTRLALEKAQAVFKTLEQKALTEDFLVLGADTAVVIEEEILGKPASKDDAARMLRLLSGRTHRVITGVCLLTSNATEVVAETTSVMMNAIPEAELEAYIATGEPMDKAGAYAIQGYAARWIPRIEGCYFNVVGLPLALVANRISRIEAKTGQSE